MVDAKTNVEVEVKERGARETARQLGNVREQVGGMVNFAPKIVGLGTAIAGLAQAARIVIPEMDRLLQSISNVAATTAGFTQIGAAFGPKGAGIGAAAGFLLGAGTEAVRFFRSPEQEQQQQQEAAGPQQFQTTNNLAVNLNISRATLDEIPQQVSALLREELGRRTSGSFLGGLEEETLFRIRATRR